MDWQLVSSEDVGDAVLCDFCNADYTHSDEQGGVLVGSSAVCPACVAKGSLIEPQEVTEHCPAGLSFRDWVLQIRGGDNTIKIYHA